MRGREYTRQELLVELSAAASRLHDVGARGDLRRFIDDEVKSVVATLAEADRLLAAT